MQTKTVYSFDRETGEYRGPAVAHANPRRPGAYLLPAFSTEAAPPAIGERQAAVYLADAWQVVPDWRGHTYWLSDGSRHQIAELGVEPPAEALSEPPPPSVDDAAAAALREINAACESALAAIREKYPHSEVLSWPYQESEARRWQAWADEDEPNPAEEPATPLVDLLAAERGIAKDELIGRIIAKADAYTQAVGVAVGKRQRLEDEIEAIMAQLQAGEIDEDQARAEVAALAYPAA